MIYEREVKAVYRFLLSLTGSEALAEEFTQETFYRALLHIEQFQGRCALTTWLCRIAKNAWLQDRRKQRRLVSDEGLEALPSGQTPEAEVFRREQGRLTRQALRNLPEPYQTVLILRVYGELPFAEIARAFERSESWAKVTFFRGKEKLRKEMEAYHDLL